MAVSREQKEKVLKELIDKFSKAKSVIFSDYRGIQVNDLQKLRRAMRAEDAEYAVAKRTLFKIAAKKAGFPEIPDEIMEGPCAASFSYGDEIAPARIIKNFAKGNEHLKLLGGIVDGKVLSIAQTKELSLLPTKKELLAKFVGCLQGPIYGFYGILHEVMRKFVGTVLALHDQKSK